MDFHVFVKSLLDNFLSGWYANRVLENVQISHYQANPGFYQALPLETRFLHLFHF